MNRRLLPLVLAAAVAAAPTAFAQHGPAPAPSGGKTASLQGDEQGHRQWVDSPHMHAFYDATKAAFAGGADKVDVDAFQAKSMTIFGEFGVSMGWGAAKMQDHLKLIPRQIVQIVREDPHVLDSYDNFVAATFGPP